MANVSELPGMDDYLLSHIGAEHPYLHALYRATHLHLLRPRMASGHLQGEMLAMITALLNPATVLEIGTYSGYSALCIARAMRSGGRLMTYEINDEQEDFTRPWIENSPWADRVEFHIGDALELVPQTDVRFDMAFVDGDKRRYCDYYSMIMPRLNPGGVIIADNTLWDGHVLESSYAGDAQTRGIMEFNDMVAADSRVQKVIIPMRDGLTVIRKLREDECGL